MKASRSWLSGWVLFSVCALGAWVFGGCGTAADEPALTEQDQSLGGTCNQRSEPACLGLTLGATCQSTGHCRGDPDYPGACDCIIPPPPPPPPPCKCADGSTAGQSCHLPNGSLGVCEGVITGMMFYCACQ